jgi:hypothetical protein
MPTNRKEIIKEYLSSWNNMISQKKEILEISEIDFSALSSWVLDCYDSFDTIYSVLLRKIDSAEPHDLSLLHECISDIYFDLKHIQEHIQAAESGFLKLMRVIAEPEV